MRFRLRQFFLPALLGVALATGVRAQSDAAALVIHGPDGFSLADPTDMPVGDAPTVLLRMTEAGGWVMKTLDRGDIPSDELAMMSRFGSFEMTEPYARALTSRPRMSGVYAPGLAPEVFQLAEIETHRTVLFEITARLGQLDMDDALVVQLSENDALRRLEVSEDVNSGALEVRFVFDSLDEWTRWRDAPETTQMLDALRSATDQMRTRMEVRQ